MPVMRQAAPRLWTVSSAEPVSTIDGTDSISSPHVDIRKGVRDDDTLHHSAGSLDLPPPVPRPKNSPGRRLKASKEEEDVISRSHRSSSRSRGRKQSSSQSPKIQGKHASRSESRGKHKSPKRSESRTRSQSKNRRKEARSGSFLEGEEEEPLKSSSDHDIDLNSSFRSSNSESKRRKESRRLARSRSLSEDFEEQPLKSSSDPDVDFISGRRSKSKSRSQSRESRRAARNSRSEVSDPLALKSSSDHEIDFSSDRKKKVKDKSSKHDTLSKSEHVPKRGKSPRKESHGKDSFEALLQKSRTTNQKTPSRGLSRSQSMFMKGERKSTELSKSEHGSRRRRSSSRDSRKSRSSSKSGDRRRAVKGGLSTSDHGVRPRRRGSLKTSPEQVSPVSVLPLFLPSTSSARKCPKGSKQDMQSDAQSLRPTTRVHMARGRNAMLASLEAEYMNAQQRQPAPKGEPSLREQLEEAKEKWVNIRADTDKQISAMRRKFFDQKQAMLQDFAIRKRALRQDSEPGEVVEESVEEKDNALELQLLQQENEELTKEIDELAGQIREAQKERIELERVNKEVTKVMTSLNAYVEKKTRDQEKLRAAESRLETIFRGSLALLLEPSVKKVYRRCMYKCLEATHTADRYDHDVYMESLQLVTACEKELGCELLQAGRAIPMETTTYFQPSYQTLDSTSPEIDDDVDVSSFTQDAEKQAAAFSNVSSILHESQMSTLYENRDMLVSMFKLLDKDGGGTIDMEEFQMGIDLLNRRLPSSVHFNDPKKLFEALDVDNSGAIDLKEFEAFFSQTGNMGSHGY